MNQFETLVLNTKQAFNEKFKVYFDENELKELQLALEDGE